MQSMRSEIHQIYLAARHHLQKPTVFGPAELNLRFYCRDLEVPRIHGRTNSTWGGSMQLGN
jgi:hypothetical protein